MITWALKVDDLALAAFVCVTAIEALTHNAVLRQGAVQSKDQMDALIEEGARLVTVYLTACLRALTVDPS